VLNSYLRAYPNLTAATISQRWLDNLAACEQVYETVAQHRRLRVQYEALATNPEAIMRQVCAFLEIPFEPDMLAYWQHEHHYIAGSRSARALIARYREQPVPSHTEAVHGNYYSQMDLTIKLDQRWKTELAPQNLETFYAIVGDRNRPFEWQDAPAS
jgi:hypothetical protein